MMKTVFWGAGKIGQKVLKFWQYHNMQPDFFGDNNKELWGEKINGVKVLSPHEVYAISDMVIYITCRLSEEIKEQLIHRGIPEKSIIVADRICAHDMLYSVSEKMFGYISMDAAPPRKKGCLIDLSGGMVLGGVERWSYSLAGILREIGIKGAYLVPSTVTNTVIDKTFPALNLDSERESRETDFLDRCIQNIESSGYENIICNFPWEIFAAACIIKRQINSSLHITAVVHSDWEPYYNAYCRWSKYIDECLVISEKMRRILTERGFPSEKIKKLYWKIPCDEVLERPYSHQGEPLRIGYAGRLAKSKRLDLVAEVAHCLKKKGICFTLQIAGIGYYEDCLRKEIADRSLAEHVELRGLIDNKDIPGFWKKQDIYLSCSDWEGHSISQSEAMAMGAVPIVTDVSGAEDDIKNGYNGYITPLRDVDAIVSHIVYLYENREMLPVMGRRSHDMILERNRGIDEKNYWKEILNETGGRNA